MKRRVCGICGRSGRLAACVLTAPAINVRTDLVGIVWYATGRFETRLSMAPRKFAQVCGRPAAWAVDGKSLTTNEAR